MDRPLKERIIGAIVLVALVILVVPVFLDGPPDAGVVRTERVPLPGQDEEKTQTVVLERNRSEPVPVQAANATDEPPGADAVTPASAQVVARQNAVDPNPVDPNPIDEDPKHEDAVDENPARDEAAEAERDAPVATTESPAPARAAATPPRDATPAPATVHAAATGMFAVQLGSFSSKENAEQLAAELRKQGFAAFLSQLDASGRQLHRVRVGPQKDRQAAEAMAKRLLQAGHKGQVVPHP